MSEKMRIFHKIFFVKGPVEIFKIVLKMQVCSWKSQEII